MAKISIVVAVFLLITIISSLHLEDVPLVTSTPTVTTTATTTTTPKMSPQD
jgi:hypothetical protein